MTRDLEQGLRELVAMLLEADPAAIPVDSNLGELGVDSLMRLEIIAFVEQSLGCRIPEETLPSLGSISEVLEYVRRTR